MRGFKAEGLIEGEMGMARDELLELFADEFLDAIKVLGRHVIVRRGWLAVHNV
jgi:hypothetical protein